MARSFGRLLTSLWNDDDFRPLSIGAKAVYGFLISQADLEHSGIIPLRPLRWAQDLGEPVEDVTGWLKELNERRFTVADETAGELLVRSLIRRDDIWKQPNVFKAAATSARSSKSASVKAVLYHEVRRLDLTRTGRETQAIAADLLAHLEPFANPSPNPPEGFPRGRDDRSRGDAGSPAELSRGAAGKGEQHASVDNPARTSEPAGQNASGTLSEPLANHSAGVQGKGSSCIPVPVPPPHSPTPSPPAQPEPSRPLWPSAVPGVQAEEGDQSGDEDPDIPGLVGEVRKLRPAWSSKSIQRALADPAVAERPWRIVRAAMLAVARDSRSQQPGRLAHDGPWWETGPESGPNRRPPWCGNCRESTRRLEDADGYDAGPCPNCHPSAQEAS